MNIKAGKLCVVGAPLSEDAQEVLKLKKLRKLILEAISSKPTGILGLSLWNRIRKHVDGFTIPEFEDSLRTMRDAGVIACTNKRWWLTDHTKSQNWQEVLDGKESNVHCA